MKAIFDISNGQTQEWLEADGLGGFASGTAAGIRTRRYHALLLTATSPPAGRVVLVNGFDAWVETPDGRCPISTQQYAPGVVHPDGAQRIESFGVNPWPHWIFKLEDGTRLMQEIFVPKGQPMACLCWRLLDPREHFRLFVRPFLSGRDYHALHRANAEFRCDAEEMRERILWHPYGGVPSVAALSNGAYAHEPLWYYCFLYDEERNRGLDAVEDLASPGVFSWNLGNGKAVWLLTTGEHLAVSPRMEATALGWYSRLRDSEHKRREGFASNLLAAADGYIVSARRGKTIIAGYPWFTDWGRDTFIALRGLCLAPGRLADARDILLSWSDSVSEGMLPNRFPDQGEAPEYNSVDASLWFIIATHEFLQAAGGRGFRLAVSEQRRLQHACDAILDGYARGTRHGIRADRDGLLACGEPGVQLTWMDAKVGDWVVTPRVGKPVEVEALWVNALGLASGWNDTWHTAAERALQSFRERFWNGERKCLFDVVDANHQTGVNDAAIRPNQVFAVGGLPLPLLEGEHARLMVETVEDRLLTPLGLRSLTPAESGYRPHYEGGVSERDGAYHQGTVWPWLLGPFVEAWVRVHGNTPDAKREARARFLQPMLQHLKEAGLGHVSEIADAEPPHTPRGCPFQAWSVGELLRLDLVVLANETKRWRKPGNVVQPAAASS